MNLVYVCFLVIRGEGYFSFFFSFSRDVIPAHQRNKEYYENMIHGRGQRVFLPLLHALGLLRCVGTTRLFHVVAFLVKMYRGDWHQGHLQLVIPTRV